MISVTEGEIAFESSATGLPNELRSALWRVFLLRFPPSKRISQYDVEVLVRFIVAATFLLMLAAPCLQAQAPPVTSSLPDAGAAIGALRNSPYGPINFSRLRLASSRQRVKATETIL